MKRSFPEGVAGNYRCVPRRERFQKGAVNDSNPE
jgi:hypothetical protein